LDLSKLRKGIKSTDISHLKGALDFEIILPLLGIDPVSYHGDWIQASCPDLTGMHEGGDASPSFGVNTEDLGYNCFVCGGGTLTELVAGILEVDDESAVEWLEEHSTLNYVATKDDFIAEGERLLSKMMAKTTPTKEVLPDYPPDLLFQFDKIHPYVWERGLSKKVVTEKQIGFTEEHMGIVIPHFFDQKLVGIQYRHLAQKGKQFLCPDPYCNPPHKNKVPKYKNTPHFPRNTTLFNYDKASSYSWVIVVESPFTELYLESHGYPNVVATFGAGLSGEQAWLLSRFTNGVYFWPDNDSASAQWFVEVRKKPSKRPAHALILLEKSVPTFIVPAVPGAKADPADAAPNEIDRYLKAAYPTGLYPREGLRIGYQEDN